MRTDRKHRARSALRRAESARHRRRSLGCLVLAACLLSLGCDEVEPSANLVASIPDTTDTGPPPDPPTPPPPFTPSGPDDICELGEARCPIRGGSAVRTCEIPDAELGVTRWVDERCPEGSVCLDDGCEPFRCTPAQPTCADDTTTAICADDGLTLEGPTACDGDGVCRGGVCVDLCESAAQRQSYIGCEYLAVQLPNDYLESEARIRPHIGLVVANLERHLPLRITVTDASGVPVTALGRLELRDQFGTDSATVFSTVEQNGQIERLPEAPVDELELGPGAVATLILTPPGLTGFKTQVAPAAFRLRSSRPVVAYQFNPLCCSFAYSNDASLLLPVEALDVEYTFLGAPDWPLAGLQEYAPQGFTVAAAVDGTEIDIALPDAAALQPAEDDEPITLHFDEGGRRLTTTLNAGETLHVGSLSSARRRHHLDGAQISASEPVAVFSDHVCTNIPHGRAACDHLEEQLIPRSTWGERYMLAPVARRSLVATEVTYWRVVAGPEGALLTLGIPVRDLQTLPPFSSAIPDCRQFPERPNDQYNFVLGPHEDCMLATRHGVALTTSEPVMVLGFLVGQKAAAAAAGSTETGDPAMFLLPPSAQFRDSYTFLTPSTYADDYMTVIVPAAAIGGFTLDGMPMDATAPGVTANRVGGSDHVALHVPVGDGAHTVEGTAPFGLVVYAYDQYVSYAYSGGLDLVKRR